MSSSCPCGSTLPMSGCCGRFLSGEVYPQTAEELMRSRYSAYVAENIAYLRETLWPKHQGLFDEAGTARWAAENHWTGLAVIRTQKGQAADREGTVLFEAKFLAGGQFHTHRECSLFKKKAGRWYYVEGVPDE